MIPSRLLSMVSRLTPPPIVRGSSLPQLGRICQAAASPGDPTQPTAPDRPTLFSDLLKSHKNDKGLAHTSPTIADICREARARRCVFVGEQHQQPKVLSAQLQLLNHIARGEDVGTDAANSSPSSLHVVLEHWSLDDQPLLHKINRTDDAAEIDALLNGSGEQTSEGFPVAFYGQLIRLTRQLGGTVWGGFPPRSWARVVAKGGSSDDRSTSLDLDSSPPDPRQAFDEVQKLDQARFERTSAEMSGSDDEHSAIPVMPVEQYRQVSNISWAHRTFLKSMFAPTDRPDVPPGACAAAGSTTPPSPPPEAYKGFAAAQALKDTFFAHTISTLLQRDKENVVVAVCGLGHCEWSLGAPERVQVVDAAAAAAAAAAATGGQASALSPYIIITKPDDSVFWPERTDDRAANVSGPEWERNQADAILLYEWID